MAEKVAGRYGPDVAALVLVDDYTPVIPLTYWSFRFMMGLGFATMAACALVLWASRKDLVPQAKWWTLVAILTPLAPVFANSWGWIFTEAGRQPWVVYGLMTTAAGVSPSVSTAEVWISMLTYTLVYAVLAVIEVRLFLTYVRRGAEPFEDPRDHADADEDAPLQFAY
jgi:cytochrome d ubiquinol oxidase subunit I